jgi:hypothetical protein
MEVLIIGTAAALVSVVVIAAGVRTYRLWRAGIGTTQPLLMHRVLEREGATAEDGADARTLVQMATAARGCLLCRDQQTCRAWLQGESAAALQDFCPNAQLIGQLKAERSAPG